MSIHKLNILIYLQLIHVQFRFSYISLFSFTLSQLISFILKNQSIQQYSIRIIFTTIKEVEGFKMKFSLITAFICQLTMIVGSYQKGFPKIVWTYWNRDITDNKLLKMFDENHRLMAKGWEVRIVNDSNIEKYLKPIPYYEGDFFSSTSSWPWDATHRSDFMRLLILSYYGGVYFDFSTLLMQDLSWLQLDALRENPQVQNMNGQEPNVLLFTFPYYGSLSTAFIKQHNQTFKLSPGYEIWFIAAKPNTTFMQEYFQQYRQGMKLNMLKNAEVLDKVVREENIQLQALFGSGYMGGQKVLQIMIQRKQRQLDKIAGQNHQPRTLASWHYRLWHIDSQNGPFAIYLQTGRQAHYFPRYSQDQVYNLLKVRPKYFVKFIGDDRAILQTYTTDLPNINMWSAWDILHTLLKTKFFIIQKYFYPQKYVIYKPSMLYQYLIKPSSLKDTFNVVDSHYKPSNIDLQSIKGMMIFWGFAKLIVIVWVGSLITCLVIKYRQKKKFITNVRIQDENQNLSIPQTLQSRQNQSNKNQLH